MKPTLAARVVPGILLWMAMSSATVPCRGQGDGIFADFNTSMGSFTCRVEYAKAPKASANFIGLATGERAWLDLTTGVVKSEPFYNGQIFHRVIAGFMNQGGSPNGMGTDGPGYTLVDEFDPTLRHDSFGILSSANSGPDSSGSQFFVTVGPTPWLDDLHTVFGEVVGGSNVVYAINHVATDENDRPLTNIVIQSVILRRVGAAAEAFDIDAQGLPDVAGLNTAIRTAGTNVSLNFSNQLNVDNRLYSAADPAAAQWLRIRQRLETESPLTNSFTVPIADDKQFFRMAQVRYPDALHVPRNVLGTTITLTFTTGQGTLVLGFDGAGTGVYDHNGTQGTILGYNWIQDPYRGRLKPIGYSGLLPMDLHLAFDSATVGTFKGTVYPNYPSSAGSFRVAGTFISVP